VHVTSALLFANRGGAMSSAAASNPPEPVADPDGAVIALAARGDQRAFAQLVDRHLARVHALAYRALGSRADADEVGQEAWLRAWKQLPSWQPGAARFSTWLQRITLNLVNDRLRQRREQVPIDDAGLASNEPRPEQRFSAAQRADQVRAALAALPERQRDALLLCHFEGLGNIEAAATLQVSVEALESLLSRARRTLRQTLLDAR
jgi:RNA polymerase sigma-70 factor (ECF subfamily)